MTWLHIARRMGTLDRGAGELEAERPRAGRIDLARAPDFRIDGIKVSPSNRRMSGPGLDEVVEPRVMQVLIALWRASGATVSREELIQSCWDGRIVSEHALNASIAKLRRLADASGSFEVETVPRVGYRLTPRPTDGGAVATSGPAGRKAWLPWAAGGLAVAVALGAWIIAHGHIGGADGRSADGRPKVFRDCDDVCPEMVVLPPGKFTMGLVGSPGSGDENPHAVEISYPLAVSRFDVTRRQYQRFIEETGRTDVGGCSTVTRDGEILEAYGSWAQPGYPQSPDDPVVCVSWGDARDYARWLSDRTGKPYRLLSEAEWEYAATSGGRDRASIPADAQACKSLNAADADYHGHYRGDPLFNGLCSDGYVHTSPVGRFPPNSFGLYDMLGNAWQWTSDCYIRTPPPETHRGGAWDMPDCVFRVVRGGSWVDTPAKIRASRRVPGSPSDRFNMNGFRVARFLK